MKRSATSRKILIGLLLFLALGALYGGGAFILYPDGSLYDIPVSLLDGSPFSDFLIPGIILFIVLGIFPALIAFALVKKPENRFFERLNLLHDYHFSRTFSIYTGFALIIWINIQTLIINAVDILHTIYSSLGIIIVCAALLPATREHYKKYE